MASLPTGGSFIIMESIEFGGFRAYQLTIAHYFDKTNLFYIKITKLLCYCNIMNGLSLLWEESSQKYI